MSKKPLRLEFEYSTRKYSNEYGKCYELTLRPVGDMKRVFPEGFESKLSSVASSSLETSLSIAAMQFKEVAGYRVGRGTEFSEKAYFTDESGKTTTVEPAVITLH